MSEPTVTVVVKRIRSLLNDNDDLKPVKDKFHELLLNIENLASYLDQADRRFLVEIAHESEDVVDNIVYNFAHERSERCGLFKKYVCKPSFKINTQHTQKIEDIGKRLDKEIEERSQKPIRKRVGEKSTNQRPRSWDKTQKFSQAIRHPRKLVGFTKNIKPLVEKLTRKGNKENILYIVGIEGSGKTTLVTELSNHPEIREHFKSVVWASASEKDAKNILVEILRKTEGKNEDANRSMMTEKLVEKICNILVKGPYLIILDDVEDPDNLATHLFPIIQHLSNKSKIVITTRVIPSNPYKNKEYAVSSEDDVESLAEKLTVKKTRESSVFHMAAKKATFLLLDELYKDKRVKEHFDSRKWVDIEDDWDDRRILLGILQEVATEITTSKEKTKDTSKIKEGTNVDELVTQLEKFIAKKPSLIVLHQEQMRESLVSLLLPILKDTDHRSKVIFVTNNPPIKLQQNGEYITGADLLDADHLVRKLTVQREQPSLFSIRDLDGSGSNKRLARELYNHPTVNEHFQSNKVWVPLSSKQDAEAAMHQIIKKFTENNPSIEEPSTKKLADVILSALEEKEYLLVLDDIGDAEELVFDLVSAQRSKIIITIGNPRIFRHSNFKCLVYEMQPLTENESVELLRSIASNHAESEKVKLLENCNGIPLAIVALGGLLSTKTVEEWETLSSSFGSGETLSNHALENILLLSYRDLPSDITPCFLYFSLFPKHSEIPTGMLIRMWLSEGLVTIHPPSGTQQTLENVAAQYLEELACRRLIQVMRRNHNGEIKSIQLHEKIHQLSVTKSAELGFLEKYPSTQLTEATLLHKAATHSRGREILLRRATIHPRTFKKYPTESSKLRTLVQFGKHGLSTKQYYFQHDALIPGLEPIHEHFKLLRVLILCGIRNRVLPEQVGELIFLTYLGLRATSVQALPESIGNLRQLITLDYSGSLMPSICEPLPNVLCKMTRLRHLYLPEYAISGMKKLDLSTLQNLQVLWGISGGEWLINGLDNLSPNLVKLGIVKISCITELETVVEWLNQEPRPNQEPKKLKVLKLDWNRAMQDELIFQYDLNKENFKHLHKLAFIGRLKEKYDFRPLTSLVKLELYFSHLNTDPTKMLGNLPRLKILHLWNSYKGDQWICGPNVFPKLEELQISHLPNLKNLTIEASAMPLLKRLSIFSCRKLSWNPKWLRVKELQELEILDMPRSFTSILQEFLQEFKNGSTTVGEDIDTNQNLPNIKVEDC